MTIQESDYTAPHRRPSDAGDRLGSRLRVVESLVEVRDLIPIELCQLRVKTRGGQGRFFDLGLQL